MPYWTSNPIVNAHFLNTFQGGLSFHDEPLTLLGVIPSPLANRNIADGSIVIKWNLFNVPTQQQVTLTAYTPVTLTYPYLCRNSVFVALSLSLSQTYLENHDYIIDYEAGTIRRAAGSSIPSATSVYVWYLHFTILAETTDYTCDDFDGTVTRVDGGNIPDGATVYADYQMTAADIATALIDQAILQAEDKILARLNSSFDASSTDQGLTTGATELALSIILEALAINALQNESLTDGDDRALQFKLLSASLEAQAWKTLAPFIGLSAHAPTTSQNL